MSDDPKGYRVRLVEGEVRAEDFVALGCGTLMKAARPFNVGLRQRRAAARKCFRGKVNIVPYKGAVQSVQHNGEVL